jgi:glucose repression mediator protein
MPQDVHPQAYQNNLGAPPGPQWPGGAPQVAQPPQNQATPARINDWTRAIADIPPAQQLPPSNPYEQRDGRLQGPRPPSPRQEPPRPYQEPSRHTPVRKQHTPSPKMSSAASGMYPSGPQALPQMNAPDRGPTFGGARPPALVTSNPVNGNNVAPPSNHLPPYGRPFSPPTELAPVRPLRDDHPTSPGSGYPHQSYNQTQSLSSIANGAPPPAAAQAAAEAAARERDDRPPSALKRARDWETDSGPSKKVANDEARARLDEHASWRVSPPRRMSSTTPRDYQRRSSSETRRENERRANENYHPSEAAHHPHALPQQMPPMHSIFDAAKEERKEHVEPAARKVEVDEDYDNNSDDDKRALGSAGARSSPQSAMMNGQMKQETVV